jgi:hypothetical protein
LNAKRLLPFVIVLIVLAFALGSLPRGTGGGSLLFQSTWLLYLIYLGPVVILGATVALVVFIGLNWRDIAGGIGHQMAQRSRMRKKSSRFNFIISMLIWGVAVGLLLETPGTIFNPTNATTTTNSTTIGKIVGASATPPNPFLTGGFVPAISNLVQNYWFGIAFLGLLIVGGVILVQSVRVSMKETSELNGQDLEVRRIRGLKAASDAIKLMDRNADDPRSKILACYEQMIASVSDLGAPVSLDQTARELEAAIRLIFALKGTAAGELTQLFEEARYSLHEINDQDANEARKCLESIGEELEIHLGS